MNGKNKAIVRIIVGQVPCKLHGHTIRPNPQYRHVGTHKTSREGIPPRQAPIEGIGYVAQDMGRLSSWLASV